MKPWYERWRLELIGIVLIAAATSLSWHASLRQGQDVGVIYAVALGIAEGAPVYDSEWQATAFTEWHLPLTKNVPYPPSAGFTVLPLALASFPVAQLCWFLLLAAAVVYGTIAVMRLSRPDIRPGSLMVIAAVILLFSCVRWGMTPLQGAPLMMGLLALLVVALHTERPILALLVVSYATALKFTMVFPFFGLLILHRRYLTIAASVAAVGALNLAGFARVGGEHAWLEYRAALGGHERIGTVDAPTPWDPQSVPRLDWTYLINGLSGQLELSRILALLAFAGVCLWLLREQLRLRRKVDLDTTAVFLLPLVCLGLACIYHHHYDITPVLVPLLIIAARLGASGLMRYKLELLLMAPLVLMMALLPVARGKAIAVQMFGEIGAGLFNISFSVALTFMLVGSLLLVRRTVEGTFQPAAEKSA